MSGNPECTPILFGIDGLAIANFRAGFLGDQAEHEVALVITRPLLEKCAQKAAEVLRLIYDLNHPVDPRINRVAATFTIVGSRTPILPIAGKILAMGEVFSPAVGLEDRRLHARKSVARAFAQTRNGEEQDLDSLSLLADEGKANLDAIYQFGGASKSGIHVGVAGAYTHHSRIVAGAIIDVLHGSDPIEQMDRASVVDERFVRDSGDNGPEFRDFKDVAYLVMDGGLRG